MTPNLTPRKPRLARRAVLAGALCAAWSASALAQTTDFPNRAVTVVVAFSAGSGPDVLTRMVTQRLSALWGQPVVVDNRPGGAGFVALEAVRRSRADGYTLLMLDSEHLSAVPHLYKSRNFEPFTQLDLVAPLFRTSFIVAVPAQSPWNSMSDLITAARTRPGQIHYGSWGVGSPGHLGGVWLDTLMGTRMSHVPFKDTGQLLTSVATGEVQWSFTSIPSSQAQYKAGKIKYLAVSAPKRLAQIPDVPVMQDAGGPAALELNSFGVFTAPKGAAAAVREKIHADVLKVLAEPEIKGRLESLAFEPLYWSVDETVRVIEGKSRTYRDLIGRANISIE